jgi:hypothetical protein
MSRSAYVRHVRLVGDHEDGDAVLAVESGQQSMISWLRAVSRFPGRLIGQDHVRIGHDRPRDRHALLLAAGKLGGIVVFAVARPTLASASRAIIPPLRPAMPW